MGISNNDFVFYIKKQARDLEATKMDFNSKLENLNSKVDKLEAKLDSRFVDIQSKFDKIMAFIQSKGKEPMWARASSSSIPSQS